MRRSRPHPGMWWCALTLAFTIGPAGADFDEMSSVVKYCAKFPRSVHLSEDRRTLCFDGQIGYGTDPAPFHALEQNGRFAMRSPGGYAGPAMKLSNMLRDKNATVVLYDYCLSACANYFLIASLKTLVMKDTIIAWHGGPTQKFTCRGIDRALLEARWTEWSRLPHATRTLDELCELGDLMETFFTQRRINERHIHEPQSASARKMVRFAQGQAWDKRSIFWMWHPKNHKDYFRSIVSYQSFPTSQDHVDEILARLGMRVRIFYDYDDNLDPHIARSDTGR